MEWHVNDMSIDGQFKSHVDFKDILEPLLKLRFSEPYLYNHFYCSQGISQCIASGAKKVQEVILETKDTNYRRMALSWLTNGPFWNETRLGYENDLFTFQNEDVTDQGLGECTRRMMGGVFSNVFSFIGSRFEFDTSPLTVINGIEDEFWGKYEVKNFWELKQLTEEIQKLKPIKEYNNWSDVKEEIKGRFPSLHFSDNAMAPIGTTPFSKYIAERIFILLDVLNSIVNSTGENGELNQEGAELLANHFVGEKAWFTDESSKNKRNFKESLTFKDPSSLDKTIFCPWHGKIKVNQIRIHFQWPRPANQTNIKVVYVGPKLTKE
ncbi:hypothetical protein [Desulfobacula toluolica]|uniref:Conserved uncharacterized protein n=1 Tax=Desulfobacula toluolica (strain DSM 7467 / Tol2) TaxID=651182 RepID=K0N397_DESTT|nr:hypothetical protein [Desulfobacula toluolica]CCK78584.1 conserved uncharacterized protein [Desulfobacula toluolica Tol2]